MKNSQTKARHFSPSVRDPSRHRHHSSLTFSSIGSSPLKGCCEKAFRPGTIYSLPITILEDTSPLVNAAVPNSLTAWREGGGREREREREGGDYKWYIQ